MFVLIQYPLQGEKGITVLFHSYGEMHSPERDRAKILVFVNHLPLYYPAMLNSSPRYLNVTT